MIEHIQKFKSKLQTETFQQFCLLRDTRIGIPKSRAPEFVRFLISFRRQRCRSRELARREYAIQYAEREFE